MRMNAKVRMNLRMQNWTTGLLAAVILTLVAYATHRYQVRWDWTAEKRHSLSEQSIKAIQQFDDKLTTTVYARERSEERDSAATLLDKYKAINPDLTIRYVDPDLDPVAARNADVAIYGTVMLRAGDKSEKVTELNEESLTNALVRLARGESKTIRFLVGHGEHPLEGDEERDAYAFLIRLLKGEGYQVAPLKLAEVEAPPEDTAVIILGGPRAALLPVEVERLTQWYAKNKGRLLVLADPGVTTGLEPWLKEHGITLLDGLVIDLMARMAGASPSTPLVSEYDPNHPITKGFRVVSMLPEARGLALSATKAGVNPTPLMRGAAQGWLETSPIQDGQVEFQEASDSKGPIILGAAITEGEQRLAVVGDSDFASNVYIDRQGNGDLFLNMVRWLAEDEDFIAIKPKEHKNSPLTLTSWGAFLLSWGIIAIIPLLLGLTGTLIWYTRKNR